MFEFWFWLICERKGSRLCVRRKKNYFQEKVWFRCRSRIWRTFRGNPQTEFQFLPRQIMVGSCNFFEIVRLSFKENLYRLVTVALKLRECKVGNCLGMPVPTAYNYFCKLAFFCNSATCTRSAYSENPKNCWHEGKGSFSKLVPFRQRSSPLWQASSEIRTILAERKKKLVCPIKRRFFRRLSSALLLRSKLLTVGLACTIKSETVDENSFCNFPVSGFKSNEMYLRASLGPKLDP